MKAMITENGVYFRLAPSDMRADPELQLAAVKSNGYALQYAVDLQSNYEVVRSCVKKSPWTFEYASPQLRADRELLELALQGHGEALQYASETLQANKELALLAARAKSRPLMPWMTCSALLNDPKACDELFPGIMRIDDEWIVHDDGRDKSVYLTICIIHIPTRRFFYAHKPDEVELLRGLSPPPAFTQTLNTTLGTRAVSLMVAVDRCFGEEDCRFSIVPENTSCNFHVWFQEKLGYGELRIEDEKVTVPGNPITLWAGPDEHDWEYIEGEVDLVFQPTSVTMTLRGGDDDLVGGDDDLAMFEEKGGFERDEPVVLSLPASLGRRIQSEAIFLHRHWHATNKR
jgi:hypothetical protein